MTVPADPTPLPPLESGLARVTVSGETAQDLTVCVDGVPVKGLRRVAVEVTAEGVLPVVVLEVYPGLLAINLPRAVLAALDAGKAEAAEEPLGFRATGRTETVLNTLARRAVEKESLAGMTPEELADSYVALKPEVRVRVLRDLGFIDSLGMSEALQNPELLRRLDEGAFGKARGEARLPQFAIAVRQAILDTMGPLLIAPTHVIGAAREDVGCSEAEGSEV